MVGKIGETECCSRRYMKSYDKYRRLRVREDTRGQSSFIQMKVSNISKHCSPKGYRHVEFVGHPLCV